MKNQLFGICSLVAVSTLSIFLLRLPTNVHNSLLPAIRRSPNCPGSKLILPRLYVDGAVFQAEPEPTKVWGFTRALCSVTVTRICHKSFDREVSTVDISAFELSKTRPGLFIWQTQLSARPNGLKCSLEIVQESAAKKLDIVYGDIWLCAGQSNTKVTLKKVPEYPSILEERRKYNNIRLTSFAEAVSRVEQEDYDQPGLIWKNPSAEATNLSDSKALCYLFARELSNVLGTQHVIGTINLGHKGTQAESFMPSESIRQCGRAIVEPHGKEHYKNSVVWNAMVAPLTRYPIKGVILYVGDLDNDESRTGAHLARFHCIQASLISGWRSRWSLRAPHAMPFGLVQIHPMRRFEAVAEIRWKQTACLGVVPNRMLPDTFMAVSLDMRDNLTARELGIRGGLHPRNKVVVAQRLGFGAASVAYGRTEYRLNGPFPKTFSRQGSFVKLTFGEQILHDDSETSGFYSCCREDFSECQSSLAAKNWLRLGQGRARVRSDLGRIQLNLSEVCQDGRLPAGLAFLHEGVPVERFLANPIYSRDRFRLPAGPWKISLETLKWAC